MEQQHTARPFSEPPAHLWATGAKANERQEESTGFCLYLRCGWVGGIPPWVQHRFLHIHPFLCVSTVYRDTQGDCCEDENSPIKCCTTGGPVLHPGRCCGTPLEAKLLEEEDAGMWLLHSIDPCQATICRPQNGPVGCNMTSVPVHSSTQHLHLKGGRVSVALLLRKSIPINLQPTLFLPMHQNVDGGERRAAFWWSHTDENGIYGENKSKTCVYIYIYSGRLFGRQHL